MFSEGPYNYLTVAFIFNNGKHCTNEVEKVIFQKPTQL